MSWIGKRIIVLWRDCFFNNGCDWVAFRVIDETPDGLWCFGVDAPDGSKHDGSKAYVPIRHTLDIIEWKEEA